ncbi:MAG TPA: RodZ domain-containing protein, partial [Candidatus Kapabacteria bacterium]|nr:RodZ domain-containing protein [Candidatus Kapabacteria bacterium]
PETGGLLRNARLAKGLSEDDVAAKLRINRHYVERMEAGDLRSLPPEPYRKAFLKEYARFLGVKLEALRGAPIEPKPEGILNAVTSITKEAASLTKEVAQTTIKTTEDVAKKIEENFKDAVDEIRGKDLWEEADEVRRERLGIREVPEVPPAKISVRRLSEERQAPTPEPTPSRFERRQPTQRLDLDRVVRKEAEAYQPPEPEEDEQFSSGISRTTKVIIGLLVVIAAVVVYSVATKKSQAPPVITMPEQQQQKPQPQPAKKAPAPAPVKTDSAMAAHPANDSTMTFAITAADSVWLSVTPDNGGNGFRGTLKKGETKQFSAKEKYTIYIGNQRSVKMTLNGSTLSGLPTVPGSNMVVRNVILTKDKATQGPLGETTTPAKTPTHTPAHTPTHTPAPPKKTPQPVFKKAPTPKKTTPKKAPSNEIKKTIPTTPPKLPQAQ